MSPTITTAIFGLVGVTVGAAMQALTARVNRMRDHRLSLADYRREKREAIYLKVLRHIDKVRRAVEEQPDANSVNLDLDPDLSVEFNLYANIFTKVAYHSLNLSLAKRIRYRVLVGVCEEFNYADIRDRLYPLSSRISLAVDDEERILHSSMQEAVIGNEFWQIKYRLRHWRRRKFDTRLIMPDELESIDGAIADISEEIHRRLANENSKTMVESAIAALGLTNGFTKGIKRLTRRPRRDTNS